VCSSDLLKDVFFIEYPGCHRIKFFIQNFIINIETQNIGTPEEPRRVAITGRTCYLSCMANSEEEISKKPSTPEIIPIKSRFEILDL
jgi:hypothetical protein